MDRTSLLPRLGSLLCGCVLLACCGLTSLVTLLSLRYQVITTLVRELKDTASVPAIRSNVLLLLSDLCIRYTALGT